MKHLKQAMAWVWLVGVAGWYFRTHAYYLSSLETWAGALWMLLPWVIAGGVFWAWTRNKKKSRNPVLRVSVWKTVGVMGLLAWMSGIFGYTHLDPAVLTEPVQVFFEGENIAVVEAGVRVEGDQIPTFQQGDLFLKWSEAEAYLPPEVAAWFEAPSVGGFAGHLALNLLKLVVLGVAWIGFTLALGRSILRNREETPLALGRAFGVGLAVSMAAGFGLAAIGQFNVWGVGGLGLAGLLGGAREWPSLGRAFRAWTWEWNAYAGLVGLFFGLNALGNLHPFPLGHDSFHLYHNTPNVLIQEGHLISGIQAYNTELLIGMVNLLTGGSQWGLSWMWWVGVVALIACAGVLGNGLSNRTRWQLLAVGASLPMVNFLLHIDMKVDGLLLILAVLAIQEGMEAWKQRDNDQVVRRHARWMGLWIGLAMGVKYTALFLGLTAVAGGMALVAGWPAAVAVTVLGWGVLGVAGYGFGLSGWSENIQGVLSVALIGAGLVSSIGVVVHRRQGKRAAQHLLALGIPALVVFAPWVGWNLSQSSSWDTQSLLIGDATGITRILEQDAVAVGCVANFTYDEIGAYTGEGVGPDWMQPLSALWDTTFTPELSNNWLTDIGFLGLGGLVALILAWRHESRRHAAWNVVALMTLVYGALWWFGAHGIVWYGLPGALGWLWLYGRWMDHQGWGPRGVVVLWLVLAVMLRVNEPLVQSSPLLIAGGRAPESLVLAEKGRLNAVLATLVNTEAQRESVVYLGGGGFSVYHIENNHERVIRDGFYNTYRCLLEKETFEETLAQFRAYGIEYVVLSKDNLKAEADPLGPLHQAYEAVALFAANALEEVYYSPEATLYRLPSDS